MWPGYVCFEKEYEIFKQKSTRPFRPGIGNEPYGTIENYNWVG